MSDVPIMLTAEWLGKQIYRGVLGRAADPIGLEHLVERFCTQGLEAAASAITDMLGSEEFLVRWQTQLSPETKLKPKGRPDTLVLDLSNPEAQRCLGVGWHAPEPSGTWATGSYSILQFTGIPWQDDAILFLEVVAAGDAQFRPEQRIEVTVNGKAVGRFIIANRRPCTLICHVPGELFRSKSGFVIAIEHPDMFVPAELLHGSSERRDLSIQLREARLERLTPARSALIAHLRTSLSDPLASVTGNTSAPDIDLARVAAGFESLGNNCEFGFVQRAFGCEPLSFLRFTGMPLHKLLRGLRCDFSDLATSGHFHIDANTIQADWIGRDDQYLLLYHTGQPQISTVPAHVAQQESARLRYLARKLLDDIEDGDKILVIKDDSGLTPEQIASLAELLWERGPATLLWVGLASPEHPSGSVDLLCPGVLHGYIDHYADLDAGDHTIAYDSWRQVLIGAAALHIKARRSSVS